jgi:predicted PurR-regulated permease PerM
MDYQSNASTQELLCEMAALQRRNRYLSLVTTTAIVIMAAALIISLVLVVPKLTTALDHARSTLDDTQQIIQRISTSLDNLDSIGEQLEGLTGEGAEKLEKLLDVINTVDLEALTTSIQRFNSVIEGFSNFSLFG